MAQGMESLSLLPDGGFGFWEGKERGRLKLLSFNGCDTSASPFCPIVFSWRKFRVRTVPCNFSILRLLRWLAYFGGGTLFYFIRLDLFPFYIWRGKERVVYLFKIQMDGIGLAWLR